MFFDKLLRDRNTYTVRSIYIVTRYKILFINKTLSLNWL